MSTGKTERCPVSLFYICLVSAEDICLVSTADICPVSTADISSVTRPDICLVSTHNVDVSEISIVAISVFKSQVGGQALNHQKWDETGPEWSPGLQNPPK